MSINATPQTLYSLTNGTSSLIRRFFYFEFFLRFATECCTKIQSLSGEFNRNLTIPEPCRFFHPNLIFQLCFAFGSTRENQTSLNSDVSFNQKSTLINRREKKVYSSDLSSAHCFSICALLSGS